MKNFNKYQFLRELENDIKTEIENGNIEKDYDSIQDYINQQIENETIYYFDCWSIACEFNAHDFETEFGKAENINQLAFYSLLEYTQQEININELINE